MLDHLTARLDNKIPALCSRVPQSRSGCKSMVVLSTLLSTSRCVNELFTRLKGRNVAQVDGRKIRVSGNNELDRALIGTGFPFRQADSEMEPYLSMLGQVVKNTSGVRRPCCSRSGSFVIVVAGLFARFCGKPVLQTLGPCNWHLNNPQKLGGVVSALATRRESPLQRCMCWLECRESNRGLCETPGVKEIN